MDEEFDDILLLEDTFGHRTYRPIIDPLDNFTDEEFLRRYRLTKSVVSELEGCIDLNTGNRRIDVSTRLQLCIALRFYASGNLQMSDADLAGVHQTTVSRIVSKVSLAIARLRGDLIFFPESSRLDIFKNRFLDVAGIPSVIGAIDGTHIPIISPGGNEAEIFRNRKGVFSVNVQCVCDPDGAFTDIVCRWPGSTHDSTIFSNSRICYKMEQRQLNGFLLGDNGYACKRYLLTPKLNPASLAERRFNAAHIRTRSIIERSFGQWKQRFRCLKYMRLNLKNTLNAIVATACLHNIAKKRSVPLPQIEGEDVAQSEQDASEMLFPPPDNVGGNATRHQITSLYFSY